MRTRYDANAIETLEGLEPVKRRPGMYTDPSSPFHAFLEAVDNAADECLSGFADEIRVCLHRDGSASVVDNGRGIPVDLHPGKKRPAVEVILTTLHSGAKFSDGAYRFSGGLHGVGVSVTNALAARLEVEVWRDGKHWRIGFERGGDLVEPLHEVGPAGRRRGTYLRFWPDPRYFDTPRIPKALLRDALRAKAVLLPGTRVVFEVEGAPEESCEWCYEDGLADHARVLLGEREGVAPVWAGKRFFGGEDEVTMEFAPGEGAEWALVWLAPGETGGGTGESYVNLIPTARGGTHVNGLRAALTAVVRQFVDHLGLLPRGVKITPEDVWQRVVYVLSVRVKEPQFLGQTKGQLVSRSAVRLVETAVRPQFEVWMAQHPEHARAVCETVVRAAVDRSRRAAKTAKWRDAGAVARLPGKLADCRERDPEENELFLVEGDSAGGSAKQARDRDTQAVLPLRGKLLNAWEVGAEDVMASEATANIAVALGVKPHAPGQGDLSSLRYGKIIILADADVDGAHIASLVVALFVRHFPDVVRAGRLYVARPPLYRLEVPAKGKRPRRVVYCLDEAELERERARAEEDGVAPEALKVLRFKGLGEMDAAQLRETAMNPDSRRLVQLVWPEESDGDVAWEVFERCFGRKAVEARRAWIEAEGNLARVDV